MLQMFVNVRSYMHEYVAQILEATFRQMIGSNYKKKTQLLPFK